MLQSEAKQIFLDSGLSWTAHARRAAELFERGYNCAQSVFAAFCEDCGLDFETALLLSCSFGGGMGRLREVCGAVTGGMMVLGRLAGYTSPDSKEQKAEHYARIQAYAKDFERLYHTYLCRDLLGLKNGRDEPEPEARTQTYYETRPCVFFIACSAALVDGILEKEQKYRIGDSQPEKQP